MEQQSETFFEKNKLLLKGLLIAALTLLMLIPASMIADLIREREARQQEVAKEISAKWANEQTITGPVIAVPYTTTEKTDKGVITVNKKTALLLPESLNVANKAVPEVRKRGLYSVALYLNEAQLSGHFNTGTLRNLNIAPEQMLWHEAKLLIGISDVRGLQNEVAITWNNQQRIVMEPGIPAAALQLQGLSASVPLGAEGDISFSMKLNIKGSGRLSFAPVGKVTDITMQSPWKSPAFEGEYLPISHSITSQGFSASWHILHISRPYPQAFIAGEKDLTKATFGVRLIASADGYAKSMRSVKYALLFIGLTFAVFFFIEALQHRRIHPLQYVLVGFALCIFYSLLLSISEYTGYEPAYLIAAAATVLLISIYVKSLFGKWSVSLLFGATLAGLYTYIYIIIQLEDGALLAGSIGLFIIVAVLMYFSKKVNWYSTNRLPAASV